MRQLLVKILLRDGQFFQIVYDEDRAHALVRDWASGQFALKGFKIIGDWASPMPWALALDAIIGMHVMDMDELRRAHEAQQQNLQRIPPYGSQGSPFGKGV
jgi:hypothetical protein